MGPGQHARSRDQRNRLFKPDPSRLAEPAVFRNGTALAAWTRLFVRGWVEFVPANARCCGCRGWRIGFGGDWLLADVAAADLVFMGHSRRGPGAGCFGLVGLSPYQALGTGKRAVESANRRLHA